MKRRPPATDRNLSSSLPNLDCFATAFSLGNYPHTPEDPKPFKQDRGYKGDEEEEYSRPREQKGVTEKEGGAAKKVHLVYSHVVRTQLVLPVAFNFVLGRVQLFKHPDCPCKVTDGGTSFWFCESAIGYLAGPSCQASYAKLQRRGAGCVLEFDPCRILTDFEIARILQQLNVGLLVSAVKYRIKRVEVFLPVQTSQARSFALAIRNDLCQDDSPHRLHLHQYKGSENKRHFLFGHITDTTMDVPSDSDLRLAMYHIPMSVTGYHTKLELLHYLPRGKYLTREKALLVQKAFAELLRAIAVFYDIKPVALGPRQRGIILQPSAGRGPSYTPEQFEWAARLAGERSGRCFNNWLRLICCRPLRRQHIGRYRLRMGVSQ